MQTHVLSYLDIICRPKFWLVVSTIPSFCLVFSLPTMPFSFYIHLSKLGYWWIWSQPSKKLRTRTSRVRQKEASHMEEEGEVGVVLIISFLSNFHTHQHHHIPKQKLRGKTVHEVLRWNRELALAIAMEEEAHSWIDTSTRRPLKVRLLILVFFWGR